jgi:CheY-like chemotaxis protein
MPKTILIVDDETNIRTSLANILQKLGYKIVEAEDGQDAIEKARATKPDLVLMDTMMPGMDGLEACRQIKKVEKLPCKIILYTAKIDAVGAAEARGCGVDDYYIKGQNPEYLLEMIKKLI